MRESIVLKRSCVLLGMITDMPLACIHVTGTSRAAVLKHVACEWSTSNHGSGVAGQLCMQLLRQGHKGEVRHPG